MSERTRLLFLIPSLAAGGAERQLCELVKHLDLARFEVQVAVFYGPEGGNRCELWPELASLPGIGLHSLQKRRGPLGYLTAIPRALGLVRRLRPDILHGYTDANLLALLLGTLHRRHVVWGIRRTSQDNSKMDRLSRTLLRVMVRLAPFVDLVIFNSEAGRLNHERMGLHARRMLVVTNGFDTDRFSPEAAQGAARRKEWGIPETVPLVGIVGRLDPVKDHPTFLRTAARVGQEWPEARFVCVGGGPSGYGQELRDLAARLGIADRVLWPGACTRMAEVYNALSVLVLTSTDEGFPNVLGEAMACGVPCVATRVGDAAQLVGEIGFTAEVGDDAALAAGVCTLLGEAGAGRGERSLAARQRIRALFSTEALAHNTQQALLELQAGPQDAFPSGSPP
jgi:glycosyltransferase involved in cell wall biosynthesis